MLLQEVNPFLRCAVQFRYARTHSVRCPADARILYVIDGAGRLFLEGVEHPLLAGTLALIGPGVIYRIELDSPLELIALNFDYTWQRQALEETLDALPPEAAQQVEKVTVADCPALSAPMVLQEAQPFRDALERILGVFQQKKYYYRQESAGLLKVLLIRLARAAMLTDIPGDAVADRLIQYIQQHCREGLTVDKIAAHFNYHAGHINRVMRRATGTTIHSYLLRCRMDAAKTLLLSTDMPINQVAEAVGFGSEPYFCNSFKKLTGISPKEYRRRSKNQ
jgi:AraC-like DNA-binding protein